MWWQRKKKSLPLSGIKLVVQPIKQVKVTKAKIYEFI
jgi:hypothetical protein